MMSNDDDSDDDDEDDSRFGHVIHSHSQTSLGLAFAECWQLD